MASQNHAQLLWAVLVVFLTFHHTTCDLQRLDCYVCKNITRQDECHHIEVCSGVTPYCYVTKMKGGNIRLGCANETTSECRDYISTTTIPTTTQLLTSTTSNPVTGGNMTTVNTPGSNNLTATSPPSGTVNVTNASPSEVGAPSIVGRSIEYDATADEKTLCCNTDTCNKRLHPAFEDECLDVQEGCDTLNSSFGICNKPHEAKDICKLTCQLCNYTDGSWSEWSSWTCGVSCGNGTQTRTRTCSNPAPRDGGLNCTGDAMENDECSQDDCPSDGNWSDWMEWGACSATCGVGLRRRDRNCTNPIPDADGLYCFGDSRDDEICKANTSCSDGEWASWESWSECSATCGVGMKTRNRSCSDILCMGETLQSELCFGDSMFCGERKWEDWSDWSDCSVTCGIGMQTRERSCSNATVLFEGPCVGDRRDTQLCKRAHCADQDSAFFVSGTPREGPTTGSIILADVITDVGGDYDNETGIFTCRIPGLYSFFVELEKQQDVPQAYCSLLVNNTTPALYIRVQSTAFGTGSLLQASNSAVIRLMRNDTVHLGVCSSPTTMTEFNTFSGNLVTRD